MESFKHIILETVVDLVEGGGSLNSPPSIQKELIIYLPAY